MNEGCEGGWPHLNAIFAENAHLVQEECAPYKQMTKGQHCSKFKDCKGEARVQKTYDVGNGYGQTSEKHMMKEILRNGALNTEFQAPALFGSYKSGILSADGTKKLHQLSLQQSEGHTASNLSDETLMSRGKPFEKVNHSVILTGWGEDAETGSKYWVARNSYGPKFGMEGDFLVARGNDDFGIESE